jgi:hypothetical protein
MSSMICRGNRKRAILLHPLVLKFFPLPASTYLFVCSCSLMIGWSGNEGGPCSHCSPSTRVFGLSSRILSWVGCWGELMKESKRLAKSACSICRKHFKKIELTVSRGGRLCQGCLDGYKRVHLIGPRWGR